MTQRIEEEIRDILRDHQLARGMQVASGATCQCGYWNGDERGGHNRPVGYQGLQWHQTSLIMEVVRGARAGVLLEVAKELADDSEKYLKTMEGMVGNKDHTHADIIRYGAYSAGAQSAAVKLRLRAKKEQES